MNIELRDDRLIAGHASTASDVVWLGAGYSCCASGGRLPLMSNFFDALDESVCPALYCFLRDWVGEPRRANVEQALLGLDQLQDLPVSDERCRALLGPDVADRARRDLGWYCAWRLAQSSWAKDHWAVQWLQCATAATTVITTNYDILADAILSNRPGVTHWRNAGPNATCHHCKMGRILLHACRCDGLTEPTMPSWRGALLKIHGSVAWQTCSNKNCNQYQCMVPDVGCRPRLEARCSCCCSPSQPVIVLPTMKKTYAQYPHLQRMWDGAMAAIEEAERLWVFGFSFPISDSGISLLVRRAILKHKRLRQVFVLDAFPDPIVGRLTNLLPSELGIKIASFRVPIDGSIPSWWSKPPLTCSAQSVAQVWSQRRQTASWTTPARPTSTPHPGTPSTTRSVPGPDGW